MSYPGFVLSNPKIKTEKIPDGGSIMHVETSLEPITDEMDFAALLEESLAKSQPERGDIVTGTVNRIITVQVGFVYGADAQMPLVVLK